VLIVERLNRFLVLFFVFLVLSSLLVLSVPSTAGAKLFTTKPSVPQFRVKFVGDYYYTPPSTTISVDEFTGKETTITRSEYYGDERVLEVTIKNQPFPPYNVETQPQRLYYEFQCKGHFGDRWNTLRPTFQSDSEYTTIYSDSHYVPASGSQMDFRVQAIISTVDEPQRDTRYNHVYYDYNDIIINSVWDVSYSGWSSVLTLTVPEPGEITTVLPTNTSDSSGSDDFHLSPPQQPLWATNLLMIIATVCLITIPIAITTYHYGQRKTKSDKHKARQDLT
jgi:hypothetical protein